MALAQVSAVAKSFVLAFGMALVGLYLFEDPVSAVAFAFASTWLSYESLGTTDSRQSRMAAERTLSATSVGRLTRDALAAAIQSSKTR